MSRTTKRKHVITELLNSEIKLPGENEILCRIITSRGNNLHEVETDNDETFLASMPSKFRRNIWVKRGDFVTLERIHEGGKVKGEITSVLTRDHIRYFQSQGVWPEKFNLNNLESNYQTPPQHLSSHSSSSSSSSESDNENNSENSDNDDDDSGNKKDENVENFNKN